MVSNSKLVIAIVATITLALSFYEIVFATSKAMATRDDISFGESSNGVRRDLLIAPVTPINTTSTSTATGSTGNRYVHSENIQTSLMRTNNDNNTRAGDGRPFLILHIGPPKTGTTTLQAELTKLQQSMTLRQDNYHYIVEKGTTYAGVRKLLDLKCHEQLATIRKLYNGTRNLRRRLRQVPCWKEVLDDINQYRRSNTSVIFSGEVVSTQTLRPRRRGRIADSTDSTIVDWRSIQLTLGHDWQIITILGYRRYVDWLPSAKQQHERWTRAKPRLNKWPSLGGKTVQPLFPNYISPSFVPGPSTPILYRYTDQLQDMLARESVFPIKILNIHFNETLRTNFVCNILPTATYTCSSSRKMDSIVGPEPVINPSQTLFYDALAIAAAKQNLFDTSMVKRHDMALAIQRYHEETVAMAPLSGLDHTSNRTGRIDALPVLETAATNLTVPTDIRLKNAALRFPLLCPTKKQLDAFLSVSLEKERSVVPEFASNEVNKESHIFQFWTSVNDKKYCWIDSERVLTMDKWRSFFSNSTIWKTPSRSKSAGSRRERRKQRHDSGFLKGDVRLSTTTDSLLVQRLSEGMLMLQQSV